MGWLVGCSLGGILFLLRSCSCKGWSSHQSQVVGLASQRLPVERQWESLRARARWRREARRRGRRTLCPSTAKQWGFHFAVLLKQHCAYLPLLETYDKSKIFSQRDMSQQMLCAFDANSTGITARCPTFCFHFKGLRFFSRIIFSGTSCWQRQGNQMDQNPSHKVHIVFKKKLRNGGNSESNSTTCLVEFKSLACEWLVLLRPDGNPKD